mgnify:FL=1
MFGPRRTLRIGRYNKAGNAVADKKHNQSKLEEEMVALGRDRYHHKLKRAKETALESTTSVGQHLLGESIESLADTLKTWLDNAATAPGRRHKAYEYLIKLPPKVTAGLTARSVLDCISIERKIVSTSVVIGRLLEDEIKFRKVKKDEPALWQQIHRVLDRFKSQKTKSKFINKTLRFHELVLPQWDRKTAASVGLTCIELMRQATGLIDIVTKRDAQGKSYTCIRPTDDLMRWMKDAHDYNESLSPVWLPMVEKPIEWNNPYIGGYKSLSFRRRPLIKTFDTDYIEEVGDCYMPQVYEAINTVQSTGYRVDGQVSELLRHCWDRDLPVGGLPSMEDDPLPPKPPNIKTDEEARKAWRRSAAKVHFDNERLKSKRLQVMKVLNLADKFAGEEIWYPLMADFRMRVYPVPYFLQPQGPEWATSLLNFSESLPMTDEGVKWLYMNAAARWGLDKKPYSERLKWAEENVSLLRRIGDDPVGEMTWTDADEPWLFVRACMEISRMHREGSEFRTTLPVPMDATNQGLQIYSMLLRDPVAALATNVLPGDTPHDVYQQVADIVRRMLYEDNHEYGKKWLDFTITRKTTKRQTMTVCYSSTFFSCRTYTAEWFYDELKSGRENPFGDETYRPCAYLAQKIWDAIGEVVQSARVGMDWLRSCAEILVDYGVTPRWMTPLGFPVKMHYENTNKYAIKTLVNGTLRQHRLRVANGEANRRKTINSICPNYVHSLDGIGGLLGLTVNTARSHGVRSIKTVHDSVEAHAPNMAVLHASVRAATLDIFSENQLEALAGQLEMLLPPGVSLPSLPNFGTLRIEDVLRSKYYFN